MAGTVNPNILVLSFVTRGLPSSPFGQGEEILFFRPRRHATDLKIDGSWTFLTLECLFSPNSVYPSVDDGLTPERLSERSLGSSLGLITGGEVLEDGMEPLEPEVRLVRRGRRIQWDDVTVIEAFLWRMSERYERGLVEAAKSNRRAMDKQARGKGVEGKGAGGAGGDFVVLDGEGEEEINGEFRCYQDIEARLGEPTHYWASLDGFYLEGAIESDLVSTALHSVCMPAEIESSLEELYHDHQSGAQQMANKALDVLYASVLSKTAHNAFRFWPEGIEQRPGEEIPQGVVKMRCYAYWVDVTAYHLRRVRPSMESSISYALLRALEPMMSLISDDTITVEEFEKRMVKSIATEAERSRSADKSLVRQAVVEVLWKPSTMTREESKGFMHVMTLSSSSAVFQVLTKIIQRVLTPHPDSPSDDPLDPYAGGASSRLRQPIHLHITIAESRPLNEGVTLAQRLYTVIEKAIEYNNKHAERHRKRREESLGFSPRSIHASSMHDFNPASPALSLHQKIRNILNSPDGSIGPGARTRNSMYNFPPALADLLASEAKPSKPQPKVTLEIVTDAGMPGVVTESALKGQKPILLLGADKILPSGDVVNKTGSLTVASFAKSADARVLVIARGDKVQSANDGETFDPESNSGSELCAAWFASAGNTAASDKMKMFVTKAMEGEVLKISNSYFEKIPSDFVSSYVTELGPLDIDQIKKLGDDRAALEDKVWGKD